MMLEIINKIISYKNYKIKYFYIFGEYGDFGDCVENIKKIFPLSKTQQFVIKKILKQRNTA